jgi:hypothetical protein
MNFMAESLPYYTPVRPLQSYLQISGYEIARNYPPAIEYQLNYNRHYALYDNPVYLRPQHVGYPPGQYSTAWVQPVKRFCAYHTPQQNSNQN